jgi:dTDP-4-dehydrorhamnose reductase
MDVFVIGGSGLVGQNIITHCRETGQSVVGSYRSSPTEETDVHLDKTDQDLVREVLRAHRPDVVIDTAAFHAVDECETDRRLAWTVNAAGTAIAARAADDVGAQFVYLSTDYVFPGHPGEAPYTETDSVAPINYYAETKYAGEQAARIADMATVLRPSVVYGLASDNFVTWALGELQSGNELRIVDDQVSCPTSAADLARAAVSVATREMCGVYHAAGPESVSRYEFTVTLADRLGYDTDLVTPIDSEELGQDAPRPADSSLTSERLYDAIDYRFRQPAEVFEQSFPEDL